MRSATKTNFLANLAGRFWMGLMSLAFLPWYIKFLGAEAYGLVGLHISIFALISFLDMGLSTAVNRGLALLDLRRDPDRQQGQNIIRTYEVIYWSVGLLLGLALALVAPLIAHHWINLESMAPAQAERAILLMAIVILFQWPIALYTGCLLGLERHVQLNVVKVIQATLQWGGAVLVLWLIEPTIQAYFVWQAVVNLATALMMRIAISRIFATHGPSVPGRFSSDLWRENKKYFSGLTALTLLSVVLTQTDRFIISKLLPLQALGYYTFAFSLANSLQYIGHPIYAAVFPRISRLLQKKLPQHSAQATQERELAAFYHRTAQVLSVFVFSIAATLAYFARDILVLWTKQSDVVEQASPILGILTIGSALNVLMLPPLALQLAAQWTSLSTYKNLVAIVFYLPLLFFAVHNYGLVGASACWVVLNLGYVLFEAPIMHRRLLKGELGRWYFIDLGLPCVVAISLFSLFHTLWKTLATSSDSGAGIVEIGATFTVVLAGTAMTSPQVRAILLDLRQSLPNRFRRG